MTGRGRAAFAQRRRDIEEQAVFGLVRLRPWLRARRAERSRVDDSAPGLGRHRRHESSRRRCRRHSECRGISAGRHRRFRARGRHWFGPPATPRRHARAASPPASRATRAPNKRRRCRSTASGRGIVQRPVLNQRRPDSYVLACDAAQAEAMPAASNTCSSLRTPALRSASYIISEFSTGTLESSAACTSSVGGVCALTLSCGE